ncbi:MAG: hypothetical protein AAF063_33905 [Cyanobacteria bacterium J06643_5]
MQITKDTSTVLKLQKKLYFLHSLFEVLLFIPFIPSGLHIIFLAQPTILKCNRIEPTQVACTKTFYSLFGRKLTTSIRQLQGAEVVVNKNSDSNGYQVILLTKNNRIPLSNYSTGNKEAHTKVSQINAFMTTKKQLPLVIKYDPRRSGYLFGGLFVLLGSWGIIFLLTRKVPTKCIFDKTTRRMYLKRQSFISSQNIEYMLDEIKEARVIELNHSDGDKTCETKLILVGGEQISLDIASNHHQIAQSINQFLDIKS